MPYNSQSQNQGQGRLGKYPIAYSFAGLVLFALIFLAILRHLTGTISVQVGGR